MQDATAVRSRANRTQDGGQRRRRHSIAAWKFSENDIEALENSVYPMFAVSENVSRKAFSLFYWGNGLPPDWSHCCPVVIVKKAAISSYTSHLEFTGICLDQGKLTVAYSVTFERCDGISDYSAARSQNLIPVPKKPGDIMSSTLRWNGLFLQMRINYE